MHELVIESVFIVAIIVVVVRRPNRCMIPPRHTFSVRQFSHEFIVLSSIAERERNNNNNYYFLLHISMQFELEKNTILSIRTLCEASCGNNKIRIESWIGARFVFEMILWCVQMRGTKCIAIIQIFITQFLKMYATAAWRRSRSSTKARSRLEWRLNDQFEIQLNMLVARQGDASYFCIKIIALLI